MSTRASRRAYILHFSFVDCTSVRAGPLHKGQPRKLHAEIHTQHHTNIVLDFCSDEPETRIIIHDVIHARTHAQTVSPSIRIRAHDSLRLQRVIPVRGGVGRAGAGAGGPGRTQWEPFSLAVPRGHAHRPRSLKFPRPLRLAPGFEACFIRSTARSKELPCAGSSSSSASTRAFLPRWSTSTSCYCTRVLPECTQTKARWLARLCALCPSSKLRP